MAKKAKLPTVTFVTPFGELQFPKITNPDTEGKYADNKFKTYNVYSDEDHAVVLAKLEEAAASPEFQAFFTKEGVEDDAVPTFPVKEFKNRDDKDVIDAVGFNFKSKYRPPVFDCAKKKLPITTKIGGGTEARIEAVIFPWCKSEKVKTKVKNEKTGKVEIVVTNEMGHGVSMRLASLQIRKLVEGGGASDGSAFADDVEGFEYDASDTSSDADEGGDAYDL